MADIVIELSNGDVVRACAKYASEHRLANGDYRAVVLFDVDAEPRPYGTVRATVRFTRKEPG